MRYQKDIYTLLAIALILAFRTWIYLYFSFWMIVFIPLIVILIMISIAIKHNHTHLSIFKQKWLNIVFDQLINIMTGNTTSSIKIIHILNHHHYHDGEHDWGQTSIYQSTTPFHSFLNYILKTPKRFYLEKNQWVASHPNHKLVKYIKIENIIMLGFFSILTIIEPAAGFFTVILPSIISQFTLPLVNYLQHVDTNSDSTYNVARNFTNPIFNLLTFNVGYHIVHHLHPKLHWSQLKSEFDKIAPKVDEKLIENSFFMVLLSFLNFKKN